MFGYLWYKLIICLKFLELFWLLLINVNFFLSINCVFIFMGNLFMFNKVILFFGEICLIICWSVIWFFLFLIYLNVWSILRSVGIWFIVKMLFINEKWFNL